MVRTFITGLRFLAISLVLYALVFFAFCRIPFQGYPLVFRTAPYYQYKGGIAWRKFREFDPEHHWDIIVLGSSHAYRGYDPRVFAAQGIRLFNLGSSAQTPMNTYPVLKRYVTARNCGLLLIDVYDKAFGDAGLESTSELTQNIPSDGAAMEMALALRDPRAVNMMALRWLSHDEVLYDDTTYVSGGFAQRLDSAAAVVPRAEEPPVERDPRQEDYFDRCIAYAREQHIPVVLVTHCAPGRNGHARQAALRVFLHERLAGTGIRYFDFSEAHHLDAEDHFYDDNHLNLAGVRLFNAQLIDSLRANGLIAR